MPARAARSSQPNWRRSGSRRKIQNVEWAQWLTGVYKDKNYDLTIISHVEPLDIGIYADPNYYFQYDSQRFRELRQGDVCARSRGLQGGAGRGAEEDGGRLRQRLPVPVAERDGRGREAQGPVEECADLRQRSLGHVAGNEPLARERPRTRCEQCTPSPDVGAASCCAGYRRRASCRPSRPWRR